MSYITSIGKYVGMMREVFSKPERFKVYYTRTIAEINSIGINSAGIVAILSVFMGAVIALQTASNMDSPLLPKYTIGYITRSSTILEFSPTIISLILAGKVGSNIASEIGTMKVTEQIDALEIMGVNSLSFLVLPKIIAAVFFFPFLIIFSMGLSILGGYYSVTSAGLASHEEFVFGLRAFFKSSDIVYALVKTCVFAFIIVSVSSYFGYYTKGGALDVGTSSTQAVVWSSIVILMANFVLTQLILM
ncbi:ABC transporter permease [Brumimicrobium glaciale]|jgi:phospholipid/cholesterol/gamma-HCH transport system permease protein|uniref:ABC transporter permease n=1 Tax=Brumimicrobium glaciale TaxID=200475 RepID=A0A4Q4KR82_9FLAO|nr:ABC transporter permease [Brumimicrobium glaciale]RYM35917.1 ABC transporter permease [Brumimicrobium glaciale]